MLQTTHLDQDFNQLFEKKWTIFELDRAWCGLLQKRAYQHLLEKSFRKASLAGSHHNVPEVRNDQILWLDAQKQAFSAEEVQLFTGLQALQTALKKFFRISVNEFECHYAFYEKGHFYQKHRDTTDKNNKRLFSFVIYLNDCWTLDDGGLLVGYENQSVLFEIKPQIGQMILFRSDLEHEVKPTHKERLSLTGWFRQ